jgi:hypothetical protein
MKNGAIRDDYHVDPRGDEATAVVEDSSGEGAARLTLHILSSKRYDKAQTVLYI